MGKDLGSADLEKGLNASELETTEDDVGTVDSASTGKGLAGYRTAQAERAEQSAAGTARTAQLAAKIRAIDDQIAAFDPEIVARMLESRAVRDVGDVGSESATIEPDNFEIKIQAMRDKQKLDEEEYHAGLATLNAELQQATEGLAAGNKMIDEKKAVLAQQTADAAFHQANLDNMYVNAKDQMRSVLAEVLASRDDLMKATSSTKSSKEVNGLEKTVGAMHLNNILYLRAKVLKHDSLPRLVAEKGDGDAVGRFHSLQTLERLDIIREDLAHYTTAQRDFQYWRDTCRTRKGNPVLDYSEGGELLASLDASENRTDFMESVIFEYYSTDFDVHHTDLVTDKVRQAQELSDAVDGEDARKAFAERFFMALFGGLTLIGPMLIMTLHPTRLTQLLTTSLFVVAVALVLACLEQLQPKDIIGATAAYAAVLVVFIGSGSGTSG